MARMKSANEGWIKVTVLDYSDIIKGASLPGAIVTKGSIEEYQIRFEEGKHKGEIKWVPSNYVEVDNLL